MARHKEGYERPKNWSKYAKIEHGENKFRVLSEPITWRVYFNHDSKPVRVKSMDEVNLSDIWTGKFWKQDPAHFWTFVVRDYQSECVNILEVTKKSVLEKFEEYLDDDDFSDPSEYDITITKTGQAKETRYSFKVWKHTKISKEIAKEFKERTIVLWNLFEYLWDPYELDGQEEEDLWTPFDW